MRATYILCHYFDPELVLQNLQEQRRLPGRRTTMLIVAPPTRRWSRLAETAPSLDGADPDAQ
jgi:hypothetical protein